MNKSQKPFLILTIIILIIILVLFFAGRPLFGSLAQTYREIKNKKEDIKIAEQNLKTLGDFKDYLESNPETFQKVINFIPSQENFTDFVVQLEAAAVSTETSLDNITAAGQTTKSKTAESKQIFKISGLKEAGFGLKITGNFLKIMAFLSDLEKLARANSLYKLEINSGSENLITASLDGAIFYQQTSQEGTKK